VPDVPTAAERRDMAMAEGPSNDSILGANPGDSIAGETLAGASLAGDTSMNEATNGGSGVLGMSNSDSSAAGMTAGERERKA
jgi:hypothetical protein